MKKTLTVNLGGTVFHIDEDAYRLLDEYFGNLRLYFRRQEGAEEIVNDIENRVSELFQEKINEGTQVIDIVFVEEVINRVGKPEELAGVEEEENIGREETFSGQSQSAPNWTMGRQRRLFRNPDDKVIGGVLSGIAAYFGWDATVVRLVALVLLICGVGTLLVVYLICWMVIPEAKTAAEKLSMRGEAVTVENIGKIVTDGFDRAAKGFNEFVESDRPRNFIQKLGDVLVAIAGFILKACLIILAVLCAPIVVILLFVMVVLIISVIAAAWGGGATLLYNFFPSFDWSMATTSPVVTIVACICVIALTIIPLGCLLRVILRRFFNWKPMSTGLKWTLVIAWAAGLLVLLISLSELSWQLPQLYMGF